MQTYAFLAFDIGATSGRAIVGNLTDGKISLQEILRFKNSILKVNKKYYWNIYNLFTSLKQGLSECAKQGIVIDSIGIDTWGVDFVLVANDGEILNLPRAYRDPYTQGIPEAIFKHIPKKELYRQTGIQFMDFNSLFQLYALQREGSVALKNAATLLFIPDALIYLLTGEKVCEYTIASTSQMVNAHNKKIEIDLLNSLNLPTHILPPMVEPCKVVGELTDDLANDSCLGKVKVVTVAGHDTGAAIAAVPASNKNFAYLSSGTWSLMGIELNEPIVTDESFALNYTNEGGVDGTIRFLKNITGMWLLEQCLAAWSNKGDNYTYPQVIALAESQAAFKHCINPDDEAFANPTDMPQAITDYCIRTQQTPPVTHAEFIRCIFEGLAFKYHYTLNNLKKLAPFPIHILHVIGGGAQNNLLNQFTANLINMPVLAGPAEATAIGNIMLQARAMGVIDSLDEMRRIIRSSFPPREFLPEQTTEWQQAYSKFLQVTNL